MLLVGMTSNALFFLGGKYSSHSLSHNNLENILFSNLENEYFIFAAFMRDL